MSDRATQSYSDYDGRTGKSIHSVQSVWMAHWTRTSYNATTVTHTHAPIALGNKEIDQDPKPLQSFVELETMSSKLSKSVKRLSGSETQTFEVINESLRTSSRTIAKDNFSLPLHTPCENVKTNSYDIGRNIVSSRPLLDNPSHLASHLLPYRDPGKYIREEGEKTQKPFLSRSFLAAENEVPTPLLRQNGTFLLDAPSTSRKLLPEFGGEEFQKIPGGSFISLLRNESSPSQVTESKELHHRSYDQKKLPHPLLGVNSVRCNTMDSVIGMAGYCPNVSQSTHGMLITKGTDADLVKGNEVIGSSKMWSEIKGKASLTDHDSPSKSFGHYKGGMKLHGKENLESSKPSKFVLMNESSAETDTMDMEVFHEKNQLCGTSSSIVKKVNKMDQNPSPQPALDCSKKEGGHKQFELDLNLELPAPTDDIEASSSKTESLDLGSILARAEQPNSSRTDLSTERVLGQDASSRWVKCLKVSASGPLAFGTKSSSLGEREASHDKSYKFLSKLTQAKTITNSELASRKRHGKEVMDHNNTSSSVVEKDLELLTSHSWIQRLLQNRAATAQKRPQPVVVCEPQSSKLELDDTWKKQLPSLGAMALMGKAINGSQPCEFHRKGPLVVWNTGNF